MSMLYMISLPINMRAIRRWSVNRGFAADEGRALHHLLNETFGKSTLKPFRLMVASGVRTATLYAYSRCDDVMLKETAREVGMPDALAVCNLAQLATKAMPNEWREGRKLAFDVRVRPVRRLLRPIGDFSRKGAEVDAYLLDVLHRFPDGPPDDAETKVRRDQVYAQWLAERLASIAHINSINMTGYERTQILRNGGAPQGPDVAFQGELTVKDGRKFGEILRKGVGRHTSYGYGMLLLRPSKMR